MSDESSSSFKVVDRRQATSEETITEETTAEESPVEEIPVEETPVESAPTAANNEAVNKTAQSSDDATNTKEAQVNDSDSGDESGNDRLPDPNFLINMAAIQMPTRDFIRALIGAFDGQALRSIGLYADPRTGTSDKDLPSAQLAIDCIQFLYGKVESSLSEDERKESQRRLSFLRMNYIVQLKG